MQARGTAPGRPPIGVALEGDFANRIDAALAVAMLNGFVAKGEARPIALTISTPSLITAQFADVLGGFFGSRPGGAGSMIGVPEGTQPSDGARLPAAILAKKTAEGSPVYKSNIRRLLDTPDNSVLIRNVLLAQTDGNSTIVVAGQATGLARLLALRGSRPQLVAKVRQLVFAAGAFPAGPPESSISADVVAARAVFADWPTPLVVVGAEVGDALRYPGASIEQDFAWSPAHPVADAYRAMAPMPYDAAAPALAAMLYAIHSDDGFFTRSEPGTISVLDDGRTRFTPKAEGLHRYLIVDPAQKERLVALYTALVSARPASRGGRGPATPAVAPPKPADVKPPAP